MEPTRRQLEILVLHSGGKTCAEVGKVVSLSEAMIRYELNCLRAKLGARNLYHVQALALARGYLAVDGREGGLFVVDAQLVAA